VRGKAAWLAAASLLLFAILGISGAIAALGDTLFPARSLAEGFRQDFDPAANIFLRLRLLHPLLAVVTAAWLGFYATLNRRAGWPAWTLLALVASQITAGVVNLLLLAPAAMQLVHLLLADLVWIALVLLGASTLQGPAVPADRVGDAMAPRVDRLERVGPN